MSGWAATKYKITNWSAHNNALKLRGSLAIWFDPEMGRRPPPNGRRARQRSFSDAAIQTCPTLKVLFGLPLRQTTGFVESLLRLAGLDWAVPDFSNLCRRQKGLRVNLPYRGTKGPLMHCMKLLGQRLLARNFDRQVAELQVRIAVRNRFTALGLPVTRAVA